MTNFQTSGRSQQGFTLVELAIVMVIIGLLIGGILKGQELIANAKVSATVAQLKGIDAGMNTFQDKYNALPGDIANAGTRLPNCTALGNCNAAIAGQGNSRIENGANGPTAALAAGTESAVMFVHLNAADLISGVSPTGGLAFGGIVPAVKAGGGMWVSYAPALVAGTTLPLGRHYATIIGQIAATAAGSGGINPGQAAQIDRKLDDGAPQTGTFQVDTGGTQCTAAVAGQTEYDEARGAGLCTAFFRVLN